MIRPYSYHKPVIDDGKLPVYYDLINANEIFGMVGRCGGGYNTVWADWSFPGRNARSNIIREFEQGLNEICGHYEKLEKSILEHGIRDPLIITCGWPVKKKNYNMPPEIKEIQPYKRFLLEGTTGGSRLWVAQKHNMQVPCIINDFSKSKPRGKRLYTQEEIISLFKDKPMALTYNPRYGVNVPFNPTKSGFHLDNKWREDQLVKLRAPLWVKIMNKYGYYVANLNADIHKILHDAGVHQPNDLKVVYDNRKYGAI